METIVRNIRVNNNPSIPEASVVSFIDQAAMDQYALANPEVIQGAVHFNVENDRNIFFTIQFNSSTIYTRGKFGKPDHKFALPLQHAVECAILRFISNDPLLPVDVHFREFPHPAFRGGSIVGTVGAPFFFAGAMFSFVISVGSVVAERETHLRQAMEGMGLRRSVWWFTWLLTELFFVVISSLFICIFGILLGFDLFNKNSVQLIKSVFNIILPACRS
eukprot:SAG31_NODE_1418_length_8439_cov_20.075540_5_plen_219_part_00